MKKLLLIASLMVIALSGCYVDPYRGHDNGSRRDQDRGKIVIKEEIKVTMMVARVETVATMVGIVE